jgi:nitrite reductase/ring-hydroxylating ferredoxin subunit
MPEQACEPQWLCAADALRDGGDAVLFDVVEFGRTVQAFAVRHQGRAVAYLNRCAHVPAEMDWQPGKFWDQERRYLICSVHGALYDPPSGQCVSGPCVGARLHAVRLDERDGQLYWYPTDRLQPVSA